MSEIERERIQGMAEDFLANTPGEPGPQGVRTLLVNPDSGEVVEITNAVIREVQP